MFKNQNLNLYTFRIEAIDPDTKERAIFEPRVLSAGGWGAANLLTEYSVAALEGICETPKLIKVVSLGSALVVMPDDIKRLRLLSEKGEDDDELFSQVQSFNEDLFECLLHSRVK